MIIDVITFDNKVVSFICDGYVLGNNHELTITTLDHKSIHMSNVKEVAYQPLNNYRKETNQI